MPGAGRVWLVAQFPAPLADLPPLHRLCVRAVGLPRRRSRSGLHELTALTFLDHGLRLDQTAAALFTRPDTVRYRLARLQRITGGSPGSGAGGHAQTPRRWWALTTWLGGDGKTPGVRPGARDTLAP
ncbi:helix-turn-helix domain-containing protein [Streptomyces roseirectus]|uniref:Helix-turn-helix domain-containing protein n=1 Tax=Streptomyces roseirectus TaxID=2768066 RepID=A0A7H0INE9_9ACTN|nr:helix-turn-helix domain-containing protein [Streptomyces roseirectus]QNP74315.1 helix-turn-helix domain-containing protein [Streptomyces roseirectus]